jgi:hypothetical protein
LECGEYIMLKGEVSVDSWGVIACSGADMRIGIEIERV